MQFEEGAIVSGKVTGLTDFGAFLELEGGKTGMIHISEVASNYVKDIREHISVGQEVKAKIISVSPEGKISLSIRKLNDQPKEKEQRPQRPQKPRSERRPANVWNGQKSSAPPAGEKQSFEDMMARFKQVSDEKMTDLKRASDSKRGSAGYSRRGAK
ncbi:MAG: S1 RNA-binding domain-containing protein [Clostridia bacterium]|nr:S1 RNA-binding domain-containing protein [Clostridia bacterium]MBQ2694745.1 S1 RNA-binding domain-containing protein [Clostridia bacterium]